MADNFIDMTVTSSDLEQRLRQVATDSDKIRKKFLNKMGSALRKEIKKQIKISYITSNHTGKMEASYRSKTAKDGSRLTVFPSGAFPNIPKTVAQNSGAKIYSRKTGNFHHEIKAKHFVQTATSVYIDSGKYMVDVEKVVNDELKKAGLI